MNGAGLGSGGGGGRKSSGGGVGGSGSNPDSAGMNRFREFMNWVFAPDASLLSSRQGSMTEQGRTPTSALTPLFASDFNFSIIPESVRSVTRHLLTKQFAHIWTPRADSDEKLDKPATPSLAAGGGFTPVSLRRSPRLLGQNSSMEFVGMQVPSPKFSDQELDVLLSCMSPSTNPAKKAKE